MESSEQAVRDKIGSCEVEISYGSEADLFKHFNSCKKNPGHKNFIPVDQFSLEHLPADYRDQDLLDCVRALADLTCRITVKYVSEDRPNVMFGSNAEYPGYKKRGKNIQSFGTGWVSEVKICQDGQEKNTTCHCYDCNEMNLGPPRHFACIEIQTAAHVVFDWLEAERSTCHFFFDKGDQPQRCPGSVGMNYSVRHSSHLVKDRFVMLLFTHDVIFAERLDERLKRFKQLHKSILQKFATDEIAKTIVLDSSQQKDLLKRLNHNISNTYKGFDSNTKKLEEFLIKCGLIKATELLPMRMHDDQLKHQHVRVFGNQKVISYVNEIELSPEIILASDLFEGHKSSTSDCETFSDQDKDDFDGIVYDKLNQVCKTHMKNISEMIDTIFDDIDILADKLVKQLNTREVALNFGVQVFTYKVNAVLGYLMDTSEKLKEEVAVQKQSLLIYVKKHIRFMAQLVLARLRLFVYRVNNNPFISDVLTLTCTVQTDSIFRCWETSRETMAKFLISWCDVVGEDIRVMWGIPLEDLKTCATAVKRDLEALKDILVEAATDSEAKILIQKSIDIMNMDLITMRGIFLRDPDIYLYHSHIITAMENQIYSEWTLIESQRRYISYDSVKCKTTRSIVEKNVMFRYDYSILLMNIRDKCLEQFATSITSLRKEMMAMRSASIRGIINFGEALIESIQIIEEAKRNMGLIKDERNQDTQEGARIPGDDRPLTIIVSHPHGCAKTVTVGRNISGLTVTPYPAGGSDEIVWVYNTPTCAGSSGAFLLKLGQPTAGNNTIHNGSCNRLNYSSYEVLEG